MDEEVEIQQSVLSKILAKWLFSDLHPSFSGSKAKQVSIKSNNWGMAL